MLGVLDLFNLNFGLLDWLLAVGGGVVAVVAIRRFRRGTKDWGLIILAGLIGALLVTRGLVIWLPSLQGPISSLLAVVLAGGSIAYQGGLLPQRGATAQAPAPAAPAAPTAKENASTPPDTKA